jgi:hypothetical protein
VSQDGPSSLFYINNRDILSNSNVNSRVDVIAAYNPPDNSNKNKKLEIFKGRDLEPVYLMLKTVYELLVYYDSYYKTRINWIDYFPDGIKTFINELQLSDHDIRKLVILINKIDNFFKDKKMEYAITSEPFVDQEYPDWKEFKIRIRIKEELNIIYDKFEAEIYQMSQDTLPRGLLDKVIIKLESFR